MAILSQRTLQTVRGDFRRRHGLRLRCVGPGGVLLQGEKAHPVERLPSVVRARDHALEESVRWGEPYSFFLAPGLVSWMVPAVDRDRVVLGFTGTVRAAGDDAEEREAVNHLVGLGAKRADAESFVRAAPVWPQRKTHEAVDYLFRLFYQVSGWTSERLSFNREKALQQRQIAQEIQRRKLAQDFGNPVDEERMLLALIRAGDRKGARRVLNQLLGGLFLSSSSLAVMRARSIELMGYLVRAAVENSPHLEPLIERNRRWMEQLVEAGDFEELSHGLRQALDDFLDNVSLLGYPAGHTAVRRALAFVSDHFRTRLTLAAVAREAGLSPFRLAHVLKETTGHSLLQHVHRLRVQAARRRLEESDMSCTDIAYEVGFNDQSYFIKHFRRLTGLTPARYRRQVRSAPPPGH